MTLTPAAQVHHLGFFDCEEAAAKCYDTAVLELRGPGAPTNFEPDDAGPGSAGLKPSVLQSLTSASLPKYAITRGLALRSLNIIGFRTLGCRVPLSHMLDYVLSCILLSSLSCLCCWIIGCYSYQR